MHRRKLFVALAMVHLGGGSCACRSRQAGPDDVAHALDAAPSTSVVANASARPESDDATPDSSAKTKTPRAWFGGPRDRVLDTAERQDAHAQAQSLW